MFRSSFRAITLTLLASCILPNTMNASEKVMPSYVTVTWVKEKLALSPAEEQAYDTFIKETQSFLEKGIEKLLTYFEENTEKVYEDGWDLNDLSFLLYEWEDVCPHAHRIEKMYATWQPMIRKIEQKLSEDELEALQGHLYSLVIKQNEFQTKIKALEQKFSAHEAKFDQKNN